MNILYVYRSFEYELLVSRCRLCVERTISCIYAEMVLLAGHCGGPMLQNNLIIVLLRI